MQIHIRDDEVIQAVANSRSIRALDLSYGHTMQAISCSTASRASFELQAKLHHVNLSSGQNSECNETSTGARE
jgi:hypothetical protein